MILFRDKDTKEKAQDIERLLEKAIENQICSMCSGGPTSSSCYDKEGNTCDLIHFMSIVEIDY
jgi:hypothetical protein